MTEINLPITEEEPITATTPRLGPKEAGERAGAIPSIIHDDDDEAVTTQAPTMHHSGATGTAGSARDQDLLRLSSKAGMPSTELDEPPTRPTRLVPEVVELRARGAVAETRPSDPGPDEPPTEKRTLPADGYDENESVTTRKPGAQAFDEVETVVTDPGKSVRLEVSAAVASAAAAASAAIASPSTAAERRAIGETFDDATEGTTALVKRGPASGEVRANEPTLAAVSSVPSIPSAEAAARAAQFDDETLGNRTEVMANAPLKHIIAEIEAAGGLPPVGAPMPPFAQPIHESPGAMPLRLDVSSDRPSGSAAPEQPPTVHLAALSAAEAELATRPRYGLLVAVVASVSILVPLTLFAVLNHDSFDDDGTAGAPVVPGVPAQAVSEVEGHDPPRGKIDRSKVAPVESASPSTSGSSTTSGAGHKNGPPSRFPFRK